MKLNRDNFKKTEVDGGMLYQYLCNETEFYLLVEGKGSRKKISVFKGSFVDRAEEFKTEDSLEAWSKFEEMLKVCEPQQGSSGGFKKNPQQTPQVMPLFAIKKVANGFNVILFGQFTTGEQETAFDFTVSEDALTYPFPNNVFVVNWSSEEIPAIVKCEVVLKPFPDVVFIEDNERDVFVFIPKSIVQQGGEEGGETEAPEDGDPTNEKGEKGKKGKPSPDKDGKTDGGTPDDGKPDDGKPDDGKPDLTPPDGKTDGGTPDDGKPDLTPPDGKTDGGTPDGGKPDDGKPDGGTPPPDIDDDDNRTPPTNGGQGREKIPDPNDDDGGDDVVRPIDYPEAIRVISEITNTQPSVLTSIRKPRVLESILSTNDFSAIKRRLNLPENTTQQQLSQQIINSK